MRRSRLLGIVVMLLQITVFVQPAFPREGDPNFILINTDDMNAPEIAFMPTLQTLAQQGLTFSRAFVTTPNCGPSRASLLRGQYAHNTGILTNAPPTGGFHLFRDLGLESSTIATWLQQFLGYRTGLIGKYMNNYGFDDTETYIPPGWDTWNALVSGQGYFNYRLNEDGTVVQYGNADEDYQTDVLRDKAIEFVQAAATDTRSFFLYLAPAAPHSPFIPAPRHRDAFPEVTGAPRPASFNEADVSDKPLWIREMSLMNEQTIAGIDEDYRKRLQMLLAVDEMLAELVTELDTLGILENTYIIFTADNGWLQGEHRFELGKRVAYDESIRVPMVIRGPGIPANEVRDHLVTHIDLGATFTDLLINRTHPQVDGRSLAPLLGSDPPTRWRNRFLVEHAGDPKAPGSNAMRHHNANPFQEFLYVEWLDTAEIELYDMRTDSAQIDSIHGSVTQNLLGRLSADLQALVECEKQGCRQAEN